MDGYLPFPKGFATSAIHHDQEPEKWSSMAVVTPIVTSTTYKQYEPGHFKVNFTYGHIEYSKSTKSFLGIRI